MGRSKGFKKKKHAKKKKRVKLEDLMDMAAERIQQKLDERQPTRDVTETVKKEQEEQEKMKSEISNIEEEPPVKTSYALLLESLQIETSSSSLKRKRERDDNEFTSENEKKWKKKKKKNQAVEVSSVHSATNPSESNEDASDLSSANSTSVSNQEKSEDSEQKNSQTDNRNDSFSDEEWRLKKIRIEKEEKLKRETTEVALQQQPEFIQTEEEMEKEENAALEDSEVEDEREDDTYKIRFDYVITSEEIQQWENTKREFKELTTSQTIDEGVGRVWADTLTTLPTLKNSLINDYKVKIRLANQWQNLFDKEIKQLTKNRSTHKTIRNQHNDVVAIPFTPLQHRLFSFLNEYYDVLFCGRTNENVVEVKTLLCLHALNHIFKTRDKVLKNNAKLRHNDPSQSDFEPKDQGFTRPKVLILVPFRNSCFEIVETMLELLPKLQRDRVQNKRKFYREFFSETYIPYTPKLGDWLSIFKGNTDETFRIGISLARKSINLYTDFYSSDIIIASPLGLKLTIQVDRQDNYDFLSSLEVVILDQADVFHMQNWDHLVWIFERLNKFPTDKNNTAKTDFSRIRPWYLDGNSKYYRQTVVCSNVMTPEMNALFNHLCFNTKGKIKTRNLAEVGTIAQVVPKVKQTWQRLNCDSFSELADMRFNYFVNELFPHLRDRLQKGVLIYIPSYFDYVRLRNFFKQKKHKDEISFTQCCEYTKDSNISRARSNFFHGRRDFLLLTERFHFYHRYKIRGIKNIVFYALPQYPTYYSEFLNMVEDEGTCLVLFSKFEVFSLEQIVGSKRCERLLTSDKSTHVFI
jgi:U3 small nucleolar RNA-associated protein 25